MEIRVFAKSRSSNIYVIACASTAGTGAKADVLLACLSCLHLAAGTGVFFREAISWPDMEIASRRTLAMTSWFDFNNTLEWK